MYFKGILLVLFCSMDLLSKSAIIFGVTGQDGIYLADLLLNKGYDVHGVRRRSSTSNTQRIDSFLNKNKNFAEHFFLHYGDLLDSSGIYALVEAIQPDEIYNLAAQSHVRVSFDNPEFTAEADAIGVLRILSAIKAAQPKKKIKFYQASSSEMFGLVQEIPQKESTPFYPRSPYGVSKLFAHWMGINYRESYGMFICNGILFNHESPLRGDNFVTRKISLAVARIALGSNDPIVLGNLDAKRDWGYAKDYVEAMWLMLQQPTPDDYVIATGETHTVREFIELAFKEVGKEIQWTGTGIDEIGYDKKSGNVVVKIDPKFFRPAEVDLLIGDCSKAHKILGWSPSTSFEQLVKIMVTHDIQLLKDLL